MKRCMQRRWTAENRDGMLSMRCYDVVQKHICKGLAKAKLLSPFDKPGSWVDLSTKRLGSKINLKEERHHLEPLYIVFFWVFKDVTATTAVDESKFRRLRFVRILVARLDGDHVHLKAKVEHQELDLSCVCKYVINALLLSWFDFMIFYTLWILAFNTLCSHKCAVHIDVEMCADWSVFAVHVVSWGCAGASFCSARAAHLSRFLLPAGPALSTSAEWNVLSLRDWGNALLWVQGFTCVRYYFVFAIIYFVCI